MKRVLIIEDQPEIRDLIRMTLEMEALDIHEAHDGVSGIQQAQRLQPHLVLLDVMLPGSTDGFAVCEQLRADPRFEDTRIVLLTARAQADDRARGLKAGADEYMVKPFSPRHLLQVVGQLT